MLPIPRRSGRGGSRSRIAHEPIAKAGPCRPRSFWPRSPRRLVHLVDVLEFGACRVPIAHERIPAEDEHPHFRVALHTVNAVVLHSWFDSRAARERRIDGGKAELAAVHDEP